MPYSLADGMPILDANSTDGSSFRDIAVGRIFTNRISYGSLLAARTVSYELLRDGKWENRSIKCGEWTNPEMNHLLEKEGFQHQWYSEDMFQDGKPVEAAVIVHQAHSNSAYMGKVITAHSSILCSPAIVISYGCAVAGIDDEQPCIASTLLGRGAVAFIGPTDGGSAGSVYLFEDFLNSMLYGKNMTVGQAMCSAFNKALITVLDHGYMIPYELANVMVHGDPALPLPTRASKLASANIEIQENLVVLNCPSAELLPVDPQAQREWKYDGNLYVPVIPGAANEHKMLVPENYECYAPCYVVEVPVPEDVTITSVEAVDGAEINEDGRTCDVNVLGSYWTGEFFEQTHADGTQTIRWRVQLLKYDQTLGRIWSSLVRATFRLIRGQKEEGPITATTLVGLYRCKAYIGTPQENDWHHVEIIADEATKTFTWRTRATGVSWALIPHADFSSLDVDAHCQMADLLKQAYGYTTSNLSRVHGVLVLTGPGGEKYHRIGDAPSHVSA